MVKKFKLLLCIHREWKSALLAECKLVESVTFWTYNSTSRTAAFRTVGSVAEAPRKAQTVEATAKTVTREQGEPVGEVAAETSEQVHDVPEATPRAKTFTGMEARQAPQTGPQGAEASAAGQSLDDSAGEAVSVNGVEMVIDGVPRPSPQAVGIQKVQIDEGLLESTKTRRRTQTKEESDPFRR